MYLANDYSLECIKLKKEKSKKYSLLNKRKANYKHLVRAKEHTRDITDYQKVQSKP